MGDKAQRAKGVKTFWLWAHDPWGTEAVKGAHSSRPIVLLVVRFNTSVFRLTIGVATVERWTCVLKMLAQWLQPARLETRTKESNTYASSKVANLGCEMKVNAGGIPLGAPSTDHELL